MCGSLITVRNGQAEPAHYTVKTYILELCKTKVANCGTNSSLLPSFIKMSLDITAVCVTYLAEQSLLLPANLIALALPEKEHQDSKKTFLDYVCIYWTQHALSCSVGDLDDLAHLLIEQFASSVVTRYWLERSLLLDPKGLWRLAIGIEDLETLFFHNQRMGHSTDEISQICMWCASVSEAV
jgi:hypothetical protein